MTNEIKDHIWMIFRFALIMVIVGLVLGVYGREITRPLEKVMELDQRVWIQNLVTMTHGHALLHGAMLPMMMAFAAFLFREDIRQDSRALNTMKKAFIVYMIGSVLMLALSTYKGTAYVLGIAGNPSRTMESINESLFSGSIILRLILFTIVHPLYATGLIWYLLRVRKAVRSNQ